MEFEKILALHAAKYPHMAPQDYGKLAYQSALGPAHLAADRDAVREGILKEWTALPEDTPCRPPEPVGGGLCRVFLSGPADEEAAGLLADLLCRTARSCTGTMEDLHARLDALDALEVPGMRQWLADYRRRGCPPVSHSEAYRVSYGPHYRLIETRFANAFPALLALRRLCAGGKPVLAAVDGRCGSGKTTLAALIQELFPCAVFHMDDFYLPPDRRLSDWEHTPAGNMDLDRFRREVLLPARSGRPVTVRAFSCQEGQYRAPEQVDIPALALVEGSYSHHPLLADLYDLRLFLTCSQAEQVRRLRLREGAHFAAFRERWIPFEERYFRQFRIQESADLVLDTSALLTLPATL